MGEVLSVTLPEICYSYEQAGDKAAQVQAPTELNACSRETFVNALHKAGVGYVMAEKEPRGRYATAAKKQQEEESKKFEEVLQSASAKAPMPSKPKQKCPDELVVAVNSLLDDYNEQMLGLVSEQQTLMAKIEALEGKRTAIKTYMTDVMGLEA